MLTILEALASMDPEDSSQWTTDRLPLVEVVAELTEKPDLTRKQITDAAPGFQRGGKIELPKPEVSAVEADLARIAEIDKEYALIDRDRAKLTEKLEQLSKERARLRKSSGAGYDHAEDQRRRMEFIRSQHAQRVAKGRAATIDVALNHRKGNPALIRRPPRLIGQ